MSLDCLFHCAATFVAGGCLASWVTWLLMKRHLTVAAARRLRDSWLDLPLRDSE